MKKLLFVSSLLLIFSCKKESNKKSVDHSVSKDSSLLKGNNDSLNLKNNLNSVDEIKKTYNLVNSQLIEKKLDSVSFDYECEERSGNVVYYSENGILKAVKHFNTDGHFSSTENYFVNDNKPYFIFKDDAFWIFDGGTPEKPETKDDITENRYYIVDQKVIQCLEKRYTIKSSLAKNPKSEDIVNKELQNCSIDELQKTFSLLMKNKQKKGNRNCL